MLRHYKGKGAFGLGVPAGGVQALNDTPTCETLRWRYRWSRISSRASQWSEEMTRREASGADADFGKAAGAGGSDGPVILRKRLQNFESAGEGNYTLGIFDFAALYSAIFDDGIGV